MRLPLCFDAAALAAEVDALPAEAWVSHPDKLPGNEAVRLVTPGGEMTEGVSGTMAPTVYLRSSPYIMHVMASIGAVWGRGRLMRLAPHATVPPHVDTNFYWRKHIRIHVPIITTPEVLFTCGHQTVHMAAGECWTFDTFASHHVRNGGDAARVHLVIDTVGGERLWDLVEAAKKPGEAAPAMAVANSAELLFEQGEAPAIMSPWELRDHIAFIGAQARPHPSLSRILKRLDRFAAGWTGIWAQRGGSPRAGVPQYRALVATLEADLPRLGGQGLTLRNQLPLYRQIAELLLAVSTSLDSADLPDGTA